MILEKYKTIIKDQTNVFKSHFERKVFEGRYKNSVKTTATNKSDYPIFNIASDNFYIYQEYERVLHSDIRNYLINPILENLLDENGFEVESFLEYIRNRIGFSNDSLEKYNICPFQFIFKVNNIRIGVRYTTLYDTNDLVRDLITEYQIDKVIILHFSETLDFSFDQYSEVIDLSHYSIKMFLDEFINENIYHFFLDTLKVTIENLQKSIGFGTIPRLNMSNLTRLRLDLRDSFKNLDFRELDYISPKKFNSLGKNDLDVICSNLEKGRAQVLLGKSDFAKSFITSEYLYNILVDNYNFDYTSVVAGYLKTIEQFLYQLLRYHIDTDESEKWIKRGKKYIIRNKNRIYPKKGDIRENPNNKGNFQILVNSNNLSFMDTSLGSLIWYISDNNNCWAIGEQGRKLLKELLLDYKESVRNGYFHKHNLEDLEEIKRIKNNTIFLLNFIIGSLKDLEITKFDALDYSFNDFFIAISEIPIHIPLYIQETKESPPQLMKRVYNQEPESYDLDGLLEQNLYLSKIDESKMMYESIEDVPKKDLVIYNTSKIPYRAEHVGKSKGESSLKKVEFYKRD